MPQEIKKCLELHELQHFLFTLKQHIRHYILADLETEVSRVTRSNSKCDITKSTENLIIFI